MALHHNGTSAETTILHVIDVLDFGGAQSYMSRLARFTPSDKYRTIVCVLQYSPEQNLVQELQSDDIPVYCLDKHRPSILLPHAMVLYFSSCLWEILRISRLYSVDCIQCHLSDSEYIGCIAGMLLDNVTTISTVHYPALLPKRRPFDPRNALRRIAGRMMYHLFDHVIAVSHDVSDKLSHLFHVKHDKITVMLNRIDVRSYAALPSSDGIRADLGLRPDSRILLTVSRLMPPKGITHLLDAMVHISANTQDTILVLAGDGDLRIPLEHRCSELGLQKNVMFLGNRSDIPALLSLADLFVLPSLSEGVSIALLEAMAARLPIIATDIEGNREVLKHDSNALLVPPADPDALARSIQELLGDRYRAKRLAGQAHSDVRMNFDIRRSITEFEPLWLSMQ